LGRDLFLFGCCTGFAYVDVANLISDHIKDAPDGLKWQIQYRQKTGISKKVPYLPLALQIIMKFENHRRINNDGKPLPMPSNQSTNGHLKEFGDMGGIISVALLV
jgi:hypothetical protein